MLMNSIIVKKRVIFSEQLPFLTVIKRVEKNVISQVIWFHRPLLIEQEPLID